MRPKDEALLGGAEATETLAKVLGTWRAGGQNKWYPDMSCAKHPTVRPSASRLEISASTLEAWTTCK